MRSALSIGTALATAALAAAAPAQALITPPVTVDGPSAEILDFGGVAMAPDGSGGLVYTKAVDGVPHVFASRYLGGSWSAPVRVDWDQPYEASQPRISAGSGGELLVVWVTQVATVHSRIQRGLFSASIGAGGAAFGASLLVDSNVGEGIGVDPSLSGTDPGQAIVAYRAITYDFSQSGFSTAVQLRPGDVMADVRLARFSGSRWSRLGAINRNSEASMRPPSATNGPQVGTGAAGGAVVAWQEPDQTGVARIWMRRVFGSGAGQVLAASPASWEGAQVSGDADALSLAVTPLNQARVAFRIAGSGSRGPRLLVNTLPPDFAVPAGALNGAAMAFGGGRGALGAPGVAATELGGGREGSLRLVFTSGSEVHAMAVDRNDGLTPLPIPPGPVARPGAEAVAAINPEGGGAFAYPALDAQGRPRVAVRQEFASAGAQTGLLSGTSAGPVDRLAIGPSGSGDALIGFRQGEPGRSEIVAERISAPPASFRAKTPRGWVPPRRARLRWQAVQSAVGGLAYSVLLEGRVVKKGLRGRSFLPPRGLLGSGVRRAQVLATDGLGQQVLSPAAKLRVDGRAPRVTLKVQRARGSVAVRLHDPDSGLRDGASAIGFGDGARVRGGSRFHHAYERPGHYTIAVRARDKVGNLVARSFGVTVR